MCWGVGTFGTGTSDFAKRAKREAGVESSDSWTVSPTELREALSGLGKAAIRFELSEMHDASEVRLMPCACAPACTWPDALHVSRLAQMHSSRSLGLQRKQ